MTTVPGHRYECETCGLSQAYPVSYNVTGKHKTLGKTSACKGELVQAEAFNEATGQPRAAQPKPGRGQKALYDQYAKKIMWQIGTSFLKSGGPYERFYRKERNKLEREKVGWADGRKHNTALRKMEKLFLSHLWEIMQNGSQKERDAKSVSEPKEPKTNGSSEPYAMAHLGHDGYIGPWEMIGK